MSHMAKEELMTKYAQPNYSLPITHCIKLPTALKSCSQTLNNLLVHNALQAIPYPAAMLQLSMNILAWSKHCVKQNRIIFFLLCLQELLFHKPHMSVPITMILS